MKTQQQQASVRKLPGTTYYVLDAQGKSQLRLVKTQQRQTLVRKLPGTMSVYQHALDNVNQVITFAQTEKHIFGAARLGTNTEKVPMFGSQNNTYSIANVRHRMGDRSYELSNHLGNVLSIISDKVIPHNNGGTPDYWLADIRQSTDYSPFGVTLEGRNLKLNGVTDRYAYSFQGQMHDDEVSGEGNSINFEYRMHNPRLGRFFAIDPLAPDYPWNSPYAFSENIVINAVELEGLEKVNTFYYNYETKSFPKKPDSKSVDNSLNKNINVYVYGYPNGGVKRTVVKSWDKTKVASSYGSMDPQLLHSNFGSISISASKSADKTHYDSWEGAANGADGQTKQTKKDYVVAGKVVVGIVTLGYGGGAIMAGEVGLLSVSSTVFAADDITGTVIGAAKDDLDGEYKPIKCGLKYTMGDFGVITYDALNLTAGTTSKFKNLVDLSKSKTSSIIPNFLDNYGLSSGGTETAGDVKELIYPTDAKKK